VRPLFEASERRIAEMAGLRTAFPCVPTQSSTSDNSVHVQRTSAKKTLASQNRFTTGSVRYGKSCKIAW